MASWIARLWCCMALACALPLSAAAAPALRLGIAPHLETLQLMRLYQPLAAHLQQQLQVPVLVHTRVTFERFARAMANAEFDLAIAPPHLARLAERRGDMAPLTGFAAELRLMALLPARGELPALRRRGTVVVAVPDEIALVAVAGESWLSRELPTTEIRLRGFRSHNNAVLALLHGDSDITMTSNTILSQLPVEQRAALTMIDTGIAMPHMVLLCRDEARPGFCPQVAAALGNFSNSSAGRAFFEASYLKGLAPVPDLRQFDRLLERIEARLPELRP